MWNRQNVSTHIPPIIQLFGSFGRVDYHGRQAFPTKQEHTAAAFSMWDY
jgi:hypothetical protein